jgi:xanthine dehydrogenase accessory factor
MMTPAVSRRAQELAAATVAFVTATVVRAQRPTSVQVVGDTPIAGAVLRLGAELGLDAVAVDGEPLEPAKRDLALVVASHGRDELHTLRRGLEANIPYVGLVASRKRGEGVIAELLGDGVPDELVERIDVPAGIDIGARTPATLAVDPICGMTVAAVPASPSVEHDGVTVLFCCEGCQATFEAQHEHAIAD